MRPRIGVLTLLVCAMLGAALALPAVAFGASTAPGRIIATGGRNGGPREVALQIRAGSASWTATSSQPWCRLMKASGTGTDVVLVDMDCTSTASFRDATITVDVSGDILRVPVRLTLVNAPTVSRWAGADRYATAALISKQTFRDADTVVIATGANYADALAAAPLAGCYDAPVLLTTRSGVPSTIATEIRRLGAHRAVIVGSDMAVGSGAVTGLKALGLTVERPFAGADRYETAAMIAEWVWDREAAYHDGQNYFDYAFLCRGDGFADALAASPMAYHKRIPILLTRPSALPAVTKDALDGMSLQVLHVVGGPSSVSSDVADATGEYVYRHDGVDRYDTAAKLTQCAVGAGCAGFGYVAIATGENFPDALTGASAAGANGGICLLTQKTHLPKPTYDLVVQKKDDITAVRMYGGLPSIDGSVETLIRGLTK